MSDFRNRVNRHALEITDDDRLTLIDLYGMLAAAMDEKMRDTFRAEGTDPVVLPGLGEAYSLLVNLRKDLLQDEDD